MFRKIRDMSFQMSHGPSSIKIVRLAAIWNFSWGGNGKLQKTAFFAKNPSPRYFLMGKFFQDRTMWKLRSRGFRKCGTFWACELFNGSFCSKSDHVGKSRSVPTHWSRPTSELCMFWNRVPLILWVFCRGFLWLWQYSGAHFWLRSTVSNSEARLLKISWNFENQGHRVFSVPLSLGCLVWTRKKLTDLLSSTSLSNVSLCTVLLGTRNWTSLSDGPASLWSSGHQRFFSCISGDEGICFFSIGFQRMDWSLLGSPSESGQWIHWCDLGLRGWSVGWGPQG